MSGTTFNITQYSVEEQKKMAALLERDKKASQAAERRRVRDALIVKKAIAAKIEVTEEEINEYLKNMTHKKR